MTISTRQTQPAHAAAFACECGDHGCSELVRASLQQYLVAARRPRTYLVAPGHNGFAGPSRVFIENAHYLIIELAALRRGEFDLS